MSAAQPSRQARGGYTLIELMIVLMIIVLIASIALAVLPGVNDQQKAQRGADQLTTWLLLAKQWALRDQAPRGVQLIPDPIHSGIVTQIQYLEQPDDLLPQGIPMGGNTLQTIPVSVQAGTNGNNSVVPSFGSFFSGTPLPNPAPVQVGDYFQIQGGPVHLISGVTINNNAAVGLTLASGLPNPIGPTTQYRIIRQPRPVLNEPILQFSPGVGIDFNGNPNANPPNSVNLSLNATSSQQIMFAPNGAVIGSSAAADRIILFVRNYTLDSPFDGGPTLITIYTKTGAIAAFPVDPTDPFDTITQKSYGSGL
jgi:prepilin-type N-terminal cleavage/methylation domain-containing protein